MCGSIFEGEQLFQGKNLLGHQWQFVLKVTGPLMFAIVRRGCQSWLCGAKVGLQGYYHFPLCPSVNTVSLTAGFKMLSKLISWFRRLSPGCCNFICLFLNTGAIERFYSIPNREDGICYASRIFSIGVFDSNGGILTLADSSAVKLVIPPGALDSSQLVYLMTEYETSEGSGERASYSPTIECGPDGLHFMVFFIWSQY